MATTKEKIANTVLRNLGLRSLEELYGWFSADYYVEGLSQAVSLIKDELYDRPIVIAGDYDADGVTSTAILMRVFADRNCSYVIPRRFSDGYGITEEMVEAMPDNGILITVDNGITAFEPVKRAKEKGMAVVIMDHHLPDCDGNTVTLPDADVIIDPYAINGSDYTDYCAAGLAYKFALEYGYESDEILSLAMIGTIADVVPLREENYVIVKRGLRVLAENSGSLAIIMLPLSCGGKRYRFHYRPYYQFIIKTV